MRSNHVAVATRREPVEAPPPASDAQGRADPWVLVAFVLPAAAVLLSLMQTEDLAYQVRAGSLMWHAHAVLRQDLFTFTMSGAPWRNQQWAAQVLLAGIHAAGGWGALVVVRALLVGGLVGATFLRVRARRVAPVPAILLTFAPLLVCITMPGSLSMRPQLFAAPLFVAAGVLLAGRLEHPRRLWWIPFIGIAWANLHGSFVLLPVLCAIAFVADVVSHRAVAWRAGLLAVVTLATPLVTPWGAGSYAYVYDLVTAPIVRQVIDEWKPILQQGVAGVLFLAALALVLAVVLRRRRTLALEDWLVLAVFTALPLLSGRNTVWWALAVPVAVAPALAGEAHASGWSRSAVRVVAAGLGALLVLALVRVAVGPPSALLAGAPPGITAALRETPPGSRVFSGRWGSWLEVSVPADRYFVDSRAELFSPAVWEDFFRISEASTGWREALDRWQIDVIVASRAHQSALIAALADDHDWRAVHQDADGVVFERVSPLSP